MVKLAREFDEVSGLSCQLEVHSRCTSGARSVLEETEACGGAQVDRGALLLLAVRGFSFPHRRPGELDAEFAGRGPVVRTAGADIVKQVCLCLSCLSLCSLFLSFSLSLLLLVETLVMLLHSRSHHSLIQ